MRNGDEDEEMFTGGSSINKLANAGSLVVSVAAAAVTTTATTPSANFSPTKQTTAELLASSSLGMLKDTTNILGKKPSIVSAVKSMEDDSDDFEDFPALNAAPVYNEFRNGKYNLSSYF